MAIDHGRYMRAVNTRLVTARRVFRRAEAIEDGNRKVTQTILPELSRLLDELEEICEQH